MLYATTRSKTDTFTAYRTLHDNRSPEGGYYIPFRMPKFDRTVILKMKDQSFSETVSQVLNVFFSSGITSWDVDCCIGKNATKVIEKGRKVFLIKLWNNPDGRYSYVYEKLYEKLCGEKSKEIITEWAYIAIRISVLFGIYSQLHKQGISSFDVCVNANNFSDPIAAWYARHMGLPIGNIVCACNEESPLWDFVYRGEINTGMDGLERYIYAVLGYHENEKYLAAIENQRTYFLHPDQIKKISEGLYVSVVGNSRAESVISSFYGTNDCILDPETAIAFGCLQDYRSRAGESYPTVVLWDASPLHYISEISMATGLSKAEIERYTNDT